MWQVAAATISNPQLHQTQAVWRENQNNPIKINLVVYNGNVVCGTVWRLVYSYLNQVYILTHFYLTMETCWVVYCYNMVYRYCCCEHLPSLEWAKIGGAADPEGPASFGISEQFYRQSFYIQYIWRPKDTICTPPQDFVFSLWGITYVNLLC